MIAFWGCLIASVAAILLAMGPVWASGSGAYRLEVSDAGAAGKGSAFVGEANTPAAVYYNPAGLTQLKGQAVSVGAALIQPHIDYTNNSGQESQMRRGNYLIPSAFYTTDLGTEKFALGVGTLSSWGLATYWHPDSFARYAATKSVMENHDYLITGAYEINEKFSVAVSMDIDSTRVDKQKKLYQGPAADANFRLKGEDDGYGYRIATLYKVNEQHQLGLMYRSPIEIKYKGRVMLEGLSDGGTTPYATIFGGTNYQTAVEAKSTLPESVVLGYSFKPNAKWTFNADLEWTGWTTTNKEELAYPDLTDTSDPYLSTKQTILNDGNPAPRDWESVIALALGTQYNMTDRFRLRGGYYYRQSPIPAQNWEPNLPDSDSHALTAGFGYDLRKDLTLDLAWSGILYNEREIQNTVADATAAVTGGIDGKYRQWTNILYATLTYKF